MRTSLNEIRLLEAYLKNELDPMDALVMDAKLRIDQELADRLMLQQCTYRLIRRYGRNVLREQLKVIAHDFICKPENKTLMQKIRSYFE